MGLVLAAMPAEFLHLQPVGGGLLVLRRRIIAILAFGALECDNLARHCFAPTSNLASLSSV
jgi:hypothetical protein